MRFKSSLLFNLFLLFLLVAPLAAVDAGKISGKVTDRQTGEPLANVNLILKGWSNGKIIDLDRPTGAASDINGDYFILNVTPGRYVLIARLLGYTQYQYSDILVNMGRTIQVNFSLTQTAIAGEQVSVVAKREVEQDVSASQIILTKEETQFLPRNTIQEVLNLTPGVTISSYDNKIDIRGGGGDQVMSYLDGFAMKDNVFNTPFLSYNRTSIEEISIQTGGFQAEYGELRSGLINVVTKEGGQNYALSMDLKYSPAGYRYDGPKKYLEDKNYLMYGSDWSMDGRLLSQKFPHLQDKFVGWPNYAELQLTDNDPNNDMTPNQARQLWLWQHRGRAEGEKPDYVGDVTFSGPFPGAKWPLVGPFLAKLSFMASHRRDYTAYEHPAYRDHFLEQSTMLKFKYKISDAAKLSLLSMVSEQWGMGYIAPYGSMTAFQFGRGNQAFVLRSDGNGSYVAQNGNLARINFANFGMQFEYVVSPRTFMEFRLSRMSNSYHFGRGPLRDTTKVKTIAAEYYTIQGENLKVPGFWDPKTGHYVSKDTTLVRGDVIWCPDSYWDETPDGWVQPNLAHSTNPDQVGKVDLNGVTPESDYSRGANTIFRFDVTSQLNKIHQLKSGFYFTESTIGRDYYEIIDYVPGEGGDDKAIRYSESPLYGALYLQDRMELKGMVGNFGVRAEYFDANTNVYEPDNPFANYFFIPDYWLNLSRMTKQRSTPYFRISPRFGISHPMTASSKIYFNYGHAYNPPDNVYRYGFITHPQMNSNIQWRGNPNLKPPKTVQYSLGYEHVLADQYLVHTEVYYKDIKDDIGTIFYKNVFSDNPTAVYHTWINKTYEDIIGWELRVTKRIGRFITGWLQTEFRGQKSGQIGFATQYVAGDPDNVSTFSQYSYPDDRMWDWTPSAMLNLDLHTPKGWGPKLFSQSFLGGWSLNSIINWSEGAKWTWNPLNSPFIYNNMQYPNYFRLDLFINKMINLAGVNTVLYVDLRNVISRKLLNYGILYGPGDVPESELYQYLASLRPGDRTGHYEKDYIVHPLEKPGENYFYRVGGPMRFFMGMQLNFN